MPVHVAAQARIVRTRRLRIWNLTATPLPPFAIVIARRRWNRHVHAGRRMGRWNPLHRRVGVVANVERKRHLAHHKTGQDRACKLPHHRSTRKLSCFDDFRLPSAGTLAATNAASTVSILSRRVEKILSSASSVQSYVVVLAR